MSAYFFGKRVENKWAKPASQSQPSAKASNRSGKHSPPVKNLSGKYDSFQAREQATQTRAQAGKRTQTNLPPLKSRKEDTVVSEGSPVITFIGDRFFGIIAATALVPFAIALRDLLRGSKPLNKIVEANKR